MIIFAIPSIFIIIMVIFGVACMESVFEFIANHKILISIFILLGGISTLIASLLEDEGIGMKIFDIVVTIAMQTVFIMYVFDTAEWMLSERGFFERYIMQLSASIVVLGAECWWLGAQLSGDAFTKVPAGIICLIFAAWLIF